MLNQTHFIAAVKKELLLRYRNRVELINPLLFNVLVTALFPLAISPDPKLLQTIGAGVIWVAVLLSLLLSLNQLFHEDYKDGSLAVLMLAPLSPTWAVCIKVFCHWLMVGVPVMIMTPVISLMYQLSLHATLMLLDSLLIGTTILCLLGAIGAALTVGLRNSGLLLTLVLLPLYVPILIFGSSVVALVAQGLSVEGPMLILLALLILAITVAPVTATAALKISLGYDH